MRDILKPDRLIAVAAAQGVTLSEWEAGIILGFLEGHDYSLLEENVTYWHDLQMEDDHSEDTPCTVLEAAEFCLDVCQSLMDEEPGDRSLQRREDALLALLCRVRPQS